MSTPAPHSSGGWWDFVVGAYRNRRYTRLTSSVVIPAVVMLPAALFVVAVVGLQPRNLPGTIPLMLTLLLRVALYPLSRELYFRTTQPLREGAGMWFVPLPFMPVIWLCRFVAFVALFTVTIPVGVIAVAVLGAQERRGHGWRYS